MLLYSGLRFPSFCGGGGVGERERKICQETEGGGAAAYILLLPCPVIPITKYYKKYGPQGVGVPEIRLRLVCD